MGRIRLIIVLLISLTTLLGCVSAPKYADNEYLRYDKDTKYSIVDETDGFSVFVYHSVYQFIPNELAVQQAAKQNAMAIAYEHSDYVGKGIQEINEQRIKMSSGRNGLTGVTTASVSLRAFYK